MTIYLLFSGRGSPFLHLHSVSETKARNVVQPFKKVVVQDLPIGSHELIQ